MNDLRYNPKGCILKAGIEKDDIFQFSLPEYKQTDGVVYMPISAPLNMLNKGVRELGHNIIVTNPTKANFFVVSKDNDGISECFSGKLVSILFKNKNGFAEALQKIPPLYKNYEWNAIFVIEDYECIGSPDDPANEEIEKQLQGYRNSENKLFDFDNFYEYGRGLQYLCE